MNNTNNNLPQAIIDSFIEETYERIVYTRLLIGSSTLLVSATLSKLSQEIEYIWSKPLSLPTFLYIMSRYAPLIYEGLYFTLNIISPSYRTCNMLANAANCMACLSFIGVQGLLVARGYSICKGSKKLTVVLVFDFLLSFVLNLHQIIADPGCVISSPEVYLLLVTNISIVTTDFVVFGICIKNVWGTWKLTKEEGIESSCSLISVLFKQSVTRCCFVTVISIANAVVSMIPAVNSSFTVLAAAKCLLLFQNSLSAILVADFTLNLRRVNSAKIEASQVTLPTIHFSNVLQHFNQSLLVELATPESTSADNMEESDEDYDRQIPQASESPDEIQPA